MKVATLRVTSLKAVFSLFAIFLWTGAVWPTHPGVGPHYLDCALSGDTVVLTWDHPGTTSGTVFVERDTDRLAQLSVSDLSYVDFEVSPGPHVYRVVVMAGVDNLTESVDCQVDVPAGRGLACNLQGNEAMLRWDPFSPEERVFRFDVFRNRELVAELPREVVSHRETLPPGEYHYVVVAQLDTLDPSPPVFVGSCRVVVPSQGSFIRGDCDGDGQITGVVTDAIFLLNFNFVSGTPPSCMAACDANADGQVTGVVTDAVYLLTFNFLGGPAPPSPFPDCGPGGEGDQALGCDVPRSDCAAGG